MSFCVTPLGLLVIHMLLVLADGGSMPIWKTQLVHFSRWRGYYMYHDLSHACKMIVHSVQSDDNGGATVTFSADQTEMDMTAYSQDDIAIVFNVETVYHSSGHFYDNLQFVVEMLQYGSSHIMVGNITRPSSNFSTITLRPEVTRVTNHTRSSDLSIGLAVGISLVLFIICIVIGIIILRWAIRKGYLRHVARSYKSFRNPEAVVDPPVSFSNAQDRESRTEEVNVHI